MSEIPYGKKDLAILHDLAKKVREIADLPVQQERINRIKAHNALQPGRPLVISMPEGGWRELLPQSVLQCENEMARGWEMQLRRNIYQFEQIGDDSPIDAYFDIPVSFKSGDFGVEVKMEQGENRGSYKWDPPIKNLPQDIDKLRYRQPRVNHEWTAQKLDYAGEVFDGILYPRLRRQYWWTNGLTWTMINLMGLEQFMVLMLTQPEDMHTFMAWLRDEHLHYITWCENEGILCLNNGSDLIGSGGWGFTDELPQSGADTVQLRDLWGLSESQESVGISTELFGEFIFPYQLPIIKKFGLACYGCCEGLQDRIDYVLRIPNLRKVSVSPWADQEVMAQKLQGKYIFSRKPNPSQICVTFDEEQIRKDIRFTLSVAGDQPLEFIMKDTHTFHNEPWRIRKWVQIAREEVDRFME
jgi:hypothetical protein